ncbi:predicted protein [Naegleria gruberi]|uniref:Predicted protein n=1 Tax=Naegleria gruberi TaxID=5762 RepID=D2VS09_NAEGR|nr:uncharacterized protein NAEGRDRAFT_71771 [Naegleria gruberi]EFC40267.1 predicted protein [Naegleria gruberi]|eukprot:XP_002673011.1 predicted protein [Naegleria gruberi strain NEG-M]
MMMKNNNYSNLMNNNNNNINHGHPMMMQHQKNPNIHPEHYNIKKSNNNGVPDDGGAQYSSGMETLNGNISNADRLAFGLKCIFVASLLFPFIIQRIASKRLNSEAINPLLLEERALSISSSGSSTVSSSSTMVLDQQVKLDFMFIQTMQRILQNTIEQFIIFSMNVLILSLYLHPKDFKIIIFATITFIVMRIAFWIGYLRHYVMRAIGFSVGMIMNIVLAISGLYLLITNDVLPHVL